MFMGTTPFITVRASRPLSEIEFCAWVAQAVPGDRLEYHRGFLAIDTCKAVTKSEPNARRELELLAERVRWSETAGLIHLVQQREGINRFSYLAIARPQTPRNAKALTQLAAAA